MHSTRSLACVCLLIIAAIPALAQDPIITGGVSQLDENTFSVDVGAAFYQGGPVQGVSLPFNLPANRTILSLQGMLSYKNPSCFAEALSGFLFDGKDVYRAIVKLPSVGGAKTLFINYEIPVSYTAGNAQIGIGSGQTCTAETGWEFHGLLRLQ